MVVLDTDHLSLLERRQSAASQSLQTRLDRLDAGSWATTIVTYEEQTRGWMAYMARAKTVAQEIAAYARLKTHIQSFRYIVVLGGTCQGRRAEMAIRPRIWPSMSSSIWSVGLRTTQRR